MTIDEWMKSAARREKLVKIQIDENNFIEAVCRVNPKTEYFQKLKDFGTEKGEEIFAAEWFAPDDHFKRMFADAEEMNRTLSPEMYDRFLESWVFANTGKRINAGEWLPPVT